MSKDEPGSANLRAPRREEQGFRSFITYQGRFHRQRFPPKFRVRDNSAQNAASLIIGTTRC